MQTDASGIPESRDSLPGIFWTFLKLGCTCFGGPIAHIGYFRHEFVEKRKWLTDASYTDLVALCSFLPGAASSKIGISLGMLRGGLAGGLASWLGFTLPTAAALIAFAYGFKSLGFSADAGWLHGLKIVAVAVIAQAIWNMGKTLCPDRFRATLAIVATLIVFAWPTSWGQIIAVLIGGFMGWRYLEPVALHRPGSLHFQISRPIANVSWILFFGLLFGLPVMADAIDNHGLAIFDRFYRAGALVLGGGHVLLPLLRTAVVPPGWVSDEVFLAGYGAAQAMPGPLFTFAAYIGTVNDFAPNGVAGGLLALAAIFLPSFLLTIGALPYWESLRQKTGVQSALRGINAVVVGLLLAALYDPVWTTSIKGPRDMALALVAFGLLMYWKVSPFFVVIVAAIGGALLGMHV